MVTPSHLRPGNWIYPTGRSKYVVVTGLLLGMMEKNEGLCKEFEGIELTGELLDAAGFESDEISFWLEYSIHGQVLYFQLGHFKGNIFKHLPTGSLSIQGIAVKYLHHLQNLIFDLTGHELRLPESALIIPQVMK